jgi:hypothetical protein
MAIWICHPNGILYLQTSSLPYKKEKKKKTWSHLSAGEIIVGRWCSLRWTTTEEVFVGFGLEVTPSMPCMTFPMGEGGCGEHKK